MKIVPEILLLGLLSVLVSSDPEGHMGALHINDVVRCVTEQLMFYIYKYMWGSVMWGLHINACCAHLCVLLLSIEVGFIYLCVFQTFS